MTRFCRTVGTGNHPRLRLGPAAAAAREHALGGERATDGGTDISPTDSLDRIVSKIIYNEVRAPEGTSAFVGQDLHRKLHRLGRMASVWSDRRAALTATALLGPGDVALAVSHSVETEDITEPLQAAAERGATTIALTNDPRSTLATGADLVLTTCARETPFRSGATVSRIAQLAVIDCPGRRTG